MKVWSQHFWRRISTVCAADPQQLALALKAESEFDQVQLAPTPRLADTGDCAFNRQAAMIPVSAPEDAPSLYFRRGYCGLAGAALTGDRREYLATPLPISTARSSLAGRKRKLARSRRRTRFRLATADPSPHWRDLTPHRTKHGRAAARQEIDAALAAPVCTSNLMPPGVRVSVSWPSGASGWAGWRSGTAIWTMPPGTSRALAIRAGPSGWRVNGNSSRGITPRPRHRKNAPWRSGRYCGRMAARSFPGGWVRSPISRRHSRTWAARSCWRATARRAIVSLDASLKASPENPTRSTAGPARTIWREIGTRRWPITAWPARMAFAGARDLASGEAHLYRGVLLYRRKNFARAEGEFASALNFEIPDALRADARAWRHHGGGGWRILRRGAGLSWRAPARGFALFSEAGGPSDGRRPAGNPSSAPAL